METIQSMIANTINMKDSHNKTLPVAKTFEPPLLANSSVELNNSTAMVTVSTMTADKTILSPGPTDTIESAAAKQNTSKKILPQVR